MPFRLQRPNKHHAAAGLILAGLIAAACVTVTKRARKDRGRFVRWMAATEALEDGGMIYRRSREPTGLDEGFPNPPLMALVLKPFHALGAVPGVLLWTLFKGCLAAFILMVVLRWPSGAGPPFPPWAAPVLVLLSAQVIHLDLTHGNTNLLIGATIVGALCATRGGADLLAGLLIGLAGVMKVTPLLFLPYFVWKRRWRAVGGVGLGLVLFALVVPGLFLGFAYNQQLLGGWYDQMVAPFVEGKSVGYMQTGYMNQSLTGWFHRLFTDAVAVWGQPAKNVAELRVNVLSLDPGVVTWIVRCVSLLVLGLLALGCRTPRGERRHIGHVGEFGLVFLGMLLLSERSWRPHFVLLVLPHAFLLYQVVHAHLAPRLRRIAVGALIVSALTHHGAFDELFGERAALYLESYGVFLLGAVALFVGTWLVLRRPVAARS